MGRPSRPPRWGGTIAGWELTRLARRGSPTVARLLVGLLLFAALLVTYLAAFPQDLDILQQIDPGRVQNRLAKFGQDFALTLLLVQAGVVVLLTPLFVAGAIVEETERRTLEFLLATDLEPREIILGKLWPRLLLVFGFVLVGWPVLAATQVWGGVDAAFVAFASIVVVATAWAMAGISAACAVGASTLRRAMVRSYFWSVIWLTLPVITCPFGLIVGLANAQEALARSQATGPAPPFGPGPTAPAATNTWAAMTAALVLHSLVQFLIGYFGVRRACFKLRHARYFYARMPWQEKRRKVEKWEQHPPVPEGSPLVWKELHLSGQTNRFVRLLSLVPWVVWLCVSSVFMVVGWAFIVSGPGADDILASMNQLVRWGGGMVVVIMALMVGLHAAGSVARERQQGTLTDLLSVPRPRREILWAKWVGSLAKARGIALGALSIPLVGVIAEGISYWAVVPLIVSAFTFLACAASFGLWLSVRGRTVQRATGLWLLVVGLWVGGTLLAAEAAYMEEQSSMRSWTRPVPLERPQALVWDRAVNPLLAWSQLVFRVSDERYAGYDSYRDAWRDGVVVRLSEILPSLLGIAVYAALAWVLYRLAARRFEREGQG
ncbi:MAG TPA: ABC transporter permease subunit [Gemmataceae bacterium]|nr:ABC transporter permease subunit [Gemmataceae bacterium]